MKKPVALVTTTNYRSVCRAFVAFLNLLDCYAYDNHSQLLMDTKHAVIAMHKYGDQQL